MAFSGFTTAANQYINERGKSESGISQFLKLDSAFKQATILQRQKDIEEARRQHAELTSKKDISKDTIQAQKEIATAGNTNALDIARLKMSETADPKDVIKKVMEKIATGGFEALNPGERAIYDDYALKTAFEKMGIVTPGQAPRPGSNQQYQSPMSVSSPQASSSQGDINQRAIKLLESNGEKTSPENIQWAIRQLGG